MASKPTIARLEETLPQLSFTLASLRDLVANQRRAVAEGDVETVLASRLEREQLDARMSRLEGQRETLQSFLEGELGVRGLRAIAEAGIENLDDRERLLRDIDDLRVTVVELQQENERCAALLSAAAEVAHQTRAYLARLTGEAPSHRPGVEVHALRSANRPQTNGVNR